MSKTLKTYEDGSEMTVNTLAVTIVAGCALAAVGAVAVVKYDSWKERRIMKKAGITPNKM